VDRVGGVNCCPTKFENQKQGLPITTLAGAKVQGEDKFNLFISFVKIILMKIDLWVLQLFSDFNKRAFTLGFVLLLVVSIFSCRKDTLEQNPESHFSYAQPDYPEKPAGRYLKSIYLEDLGMGTSGTKVEFDYDKKKYVQSYLFRDFDHNQLAGFVLFEYDIKGNATRIKLLAPDSTLRKYDDIEYDSQGRFTKISTYEQSLENENFELSFFNEFVYPSVDSIIQYGYIRHYNFEMPGKMLYLRDSSGNVFRRICFRFEEQYPYSETENYFTNKHRIFEHHGIPKYYLPIGGISLVEILSSNTLNGFQSFTYEDDSIKVPNGEPRCFNLEHDTDGYPVSEDGLFFYYYEDFD
jgi:hypothetical protein